MKPVCSFFAPVAIVDPSILLMDIHPGTDDGKES